MTEKKAEQDKLIVLWTSEDKEVALKMVFMYTLNAKLYDWWNDICLVVWGPSSRILAKDIELQEYMAKIKNAGVEVLACKACTDSYGVSEKLEQLGIIVKYMGVPFTRYIKEGYNIITI